jgi:FkbM family methyltransferase
MEFRAKTVRLPAWDLEFDVLADDAIIGPAIERGSWADHETYLFRAHATPGSRVVDLGANVGWFAVQGILAGAEVHAFEPVPAIADLCERNMARAMQRGPGRGVLHRVAAGAERGRARIVLASSNHGDNRVLDQGSEAPRDMSRAESIEIEVAPVDEFVRGPVRVVKIDTQGSEWLALRGAQRLFADSPQVAMLLEFWPYALRGARPEELLDWLFAQGFTIGKATEAPYPMTRERILRQVLSRDPVRGGIDLYATRGLPFHVASFKNRVRGFVRSLKED